MGDLLIAIALDFSDAPVPTEIADGIARSMLLGKAGDVRGGDAGGAALLARVQAPVAKPRLRPWSTQPAADGGYTVLAGQLFERAALRGALGSVDPRADDAALYAAAHMRFGDDCDLRLVGNYAAMRWFPAQRRLRVARSATSDHPMHVWRHGTRLVAASIPRALFAAGADHRLSDEALADLLLLAGPPPAGSIYAGCARVPAASIYEVDPLRERCTEFWSIADVPKVRFKRDGDYVEAVREQFERSISAHLADIRRPAVSLSGGLDSQGVAAFTAAALPAGAKLRTYTSVPMEGWVPPDRPWKFGDEAAHVRALAQMYPQIEPTFLSAAEARFGDTLAQRSLLSSWPPINETNAHWGTACYAQAAADGCDAVLRGDLGNTGFSYEGFTGYPSWLVEGNWARLLRELRASEDRRPLWRRFASLAVWPHIPDAIRRWRDRDNPHVVSPFASWCPMREDYAVSSGALTRARKNRPDFDGYEFASARAWRDRVFRWQMGASPEIYLGFALANGVALPDPTAFVPLLELCAGIPDEQYLRDGVDRWLGRRLLRGRVPDLVADERREGLQAADWPQRFVRERSEMLEELDRMRGDPRLAAIFDLDRMARDLAAWDGTDTVPARSYWKINVCVGRGLSAARFVRYAEGRNAG